MERDREQKNEYSIPIFNSMRKKAIPWITIISFVASLIVLVSSSLKTYWYSVYFGIAMSNFDYISTMKEMVLYIGPCVLVLLDFMLFVEFAINDGSGLLRGGNFIISFLVLVVIVLGADYSLYGIFYLSNAIYLLEVVFS